MIKLLNGDCLEYMDKLIAKGITVDAIITDPPYGSTACKWDSVIPFDEMWTRLNKLIKPNGAIVLFGSEPFSSQLRVSNIKNFKYDWIWEKNMGGAFVLAKKMPLKRHEMISVFYKKQPTYNPQFEDYNESTKKRFSQDKISKRSKIKSGDKIMGGLDVPTERKTDFKRGRYPTTIKKFNRPHTANGASFHPTQKPVLLMEYLIKTYTNENELVLDFTMGSGTTLVACKNLNRNGIGIELDDKYFGIAEQRVQEAVQGSSLKEQNENTKTK